MFGGDVEVTAGEASILTVAIVVIKPFESLSVLLDNLGIFASHLYPGIVL